MTGQAGARASAALAAYAVLLVLCSGCARDGAAAADSIARGQAAYDRGDYREAERQWRKRAYQRRKKVVARPGEIPDGVYAVQAARPSAQVRLAALYLEGPDGIAPDPEEAVRLLERAASRGSLRALAMLEEVYRAGVRVGDEVVIEADPIRADEYARRSGEIEAMRSEAGE